VTPWWCCQNIVCNFYHNTLLASIGKTFWTPRFVLWVSKGLIKRHFFHSAFHLIFDEFMCHNYKTGNPLKHLTSAIELSRLVLPNEHTSYHRANGSAQAWVRLKCLEKSLCQSLILFSICFVSFYLRLVQFRQDYLCSVRLKFLPISFFLSLVLFIVPFVLFYLSIIQFWQDLLHSG